MFVKALILFAVIIISLLNALVKHLRAKNKKIFLSNVIDKQLQ
jgi:hypothetical protein